MEDNAGPQVHGIVLAGAYPAGQCALDGLAPRPLLPVAQQPLVSYALRWMAAGGLRDATICANAAARPIRARLRNSAFGLRLDYLEDWTPRGAAGCVRDAGIRTEAGTFVVADGTTVPVLDLLELLDSHDASRAAVTVVVGADARGRLRPCGVYVFDRRAFDHVPEDGYQDIKEKLIPSLYRAGEQVSTHMAHGVAPRVVNADTYLTLDQWVVERASRHREAPEGFRSSGETVLHESASVDATARLLGPVLLGEGVSVRAGATLVGPVSLGPGTIVGRDAVVSRSVVWSRCVVGERAFVDRSMLADQAVVEPGGTLISALRTDRRSASRPGATIPGSDRAPWGPIVGALRPTPGS